MYSDMELPRLSGSFCNVTAITGYPRFSISCTHFTK